MKKSKFGKLALIAGGIYAVKALADKKTEETALNNIFAGLPQNATPESAEIPFSPEEFKKWLDANPALKAALKGAAGEAGSNGSNGINGDQIQNFGGSLVQNGALELGNATGWVGTFAIGDIKENLQSLIFTGGSGLSPFFLLNSECLYKISFYYKNTALNYYNVGVLAYDENGTYLATASYNTGQPLTVQSNFTKQERFIGGSGVTGSLINPAAKKFRVSIGDNVSNVTINRFILEKVSLGEPVPSNLTYLPTGQEVYDTTTGDRGRYNGTAVDWYTMV